MNRDLISPTCAHFECSASPEPGTSCVSHEHSHEVKQTLRTTCSRCHGFGEVPKKGSACPRQALLIFVFLSVKLPSFFLFCLFFPKRNREKNRNSASIKMALLSSHILGGHELQSSHAERICTLRWWHTPRKMAVVPTSTRLGGATPSPM